MVETLRSTEYNLKWNSHHSTIISMMDYLLERESLTDVTLAAEGKFVNVHRFMLFACSPYFEVIFCSSIRLKLVILNMAIHVLLQELLTQQPEKQAIIFLKDVSFANLQALVQVKFLNLL